uniref:Uncharacterized protein n=1 Tax=Sciurus vulgaris TaxID=55149 RepID=A0A8D2AQC3_SCIVU
GGPEVAAGGNNTIAWRGRLHGRAQEQRAAPDHQAVDFGPAHPAHPAHGHGLHQGQVAVDAYQHQEADAAVQVHVDHGVHHPAQDLPEEPVEVVGNGDGPEGQPTGQDQVSHRQVPQVDFRHGAAALVQAEHAEDKDVLGCGQHEQDPEEGGLGGIEQVPPLRVRTVTVLGQGPVKSRRKGLRGDVEHSRAERKQKRGRYTSRSQQREGEGERDGLSAPQTAG